MINGMLNLSKKKTSSRRDFFKVASTFIFVASIPTLSQAKKTNMTKEKKFVIIDGWVLKEEDIYDL